MLDGAWPLDFGNGEGLLGRNLDGRRNLPGLAEVARRFRAQPLGGHASLAFFPLHILGADGSGLGMGEPREVAHPHVQPVEGGLRLLRMEDGNIQKEQGR